MKRHLTHLCIIVTLLLGATGLGSAMGTKAQGAVSEYRQGDACVRQQDSWLHSVMEERSHQTMEALRPATSLPSLASPRPTRLLPTHGGKPTHYSGRWAKGESFNAQRYATPLPCHSRHWQRTVAPSPRIYYVIALRRLLC